MRHWAAVLCAVSLLAGPVSAAAAASCPRTSVSSVEAEVMCLQCGVPLSLAEDAPSAQQERSFIIGLVGQCRSKDEIKQALVAQYGDRVLALPRASGFGLAAYIVPAAAFTAALAAIAFAAIRWRRRRPGRPTPSPAAEAGPAPPDAADSARLDADLERFRA